MKHHPPDPFPSLVQQTRSDDWRLQFRRGGAWSLLGGVSAVGLIVAYALFASYGISIFILSTLAFFIVLALIGGLVLLAGRLLNKIPTSYAWVLISGLVLLFSIRVYSIPILGGVRVLAVGFVICTTLLGGSIGVLLRAEWRTIPSLQRWLITASLPISLGALIAGIAWLVSDGTVPERSLATAVTAAEFTRTLELPHPGLPGPYAVNTLSYGSGTDRRAAYGTDAAITTPTVDASQWLSGWSRLRSWYWGFGPDALPLNARVWYPEGEGPFPLVVMVHGNADMTKNSDSGYAYLGELLASRGYIFVSVDENFLNGSWLADYLFINGLTRTSQVRAILLLEHLKLWREWNDAPGNPFYNKIDMSRIALGGHSRGGEAAAIAAAFNRLPSHPANAKQTFDYGFDIRAVFALAPTDGLYLPAGRPVVIDQLNYLVLHGAHDMDVFSFMGAKQYDRVQLTDDDFYFKAALYIEGANNGQFSTARGRYDLPQPASSFYNTRQLIPAEEQRQIAAVMISAFLETTLQDNLEYLPLFQDIRVAGEWLPTTGYLNRYDDSKTWYITTFEEDLDLTTTTIPGGKLSGEDLTAWYEGPVVGKDGSYHTQAVFIAWNHAAAAEPRYSLQLPPDLQLTADDALVFDLAGASADTPYDLTLEFVNHNDETVRFALSQAAPIRPQIRSQITKADWVNIALPSSEIVFQTFVIPLAWVLDIHPQFNVESLAEIHFVFDRQEAGTIVLSQLGIRAAAQ